jgi:hypothetical protein
LGDFLNKIGFGHVSGGSRQVHTQTLQSNDRCAVVGSVEEKIDPFDFVAAICC